MIAVLRIIGRPQYRAEPGAGIGMDLPQEFGLTAFAVPSVEHGDPPPVLSDKGKDIDRIGRCVLRQIAGAADPAAAICARCFNPGKIGTQIFTRRRTNNIAGPAGKAAGKAARHRTQIGCWYAKINKAHGIDRLAPAAIIFVRKRGKGDFGSFQPRQAETRIGSGKGAVIGGGLRLFAERNTSGQGQRGYQGEGKLGFDRHNRQIHAFWLIYA